MWFMWLIFSGENSTCHFIKCTRSTGLFGCWQTGFFQTLNDRHNQILHFDTTLNTLDLHSGSLGYEKAWSNWNHFGIKCPKAARTYGMFDYVTEMIAENSGKYRVINHLSICSFCLTVVLLGVTAPQSPAHAYWATEMYMTKSCGTHQLG